MSIEIFCDNIKREEEVDALLKTDNESHPLFNKESFFKLLKENFLISRTGNKPVFIRNDKMIELILKEIKTKKKNNTFEPMSFDKSLKKLEWELKGYLKQGYEEGCILNAIKIKTSIDFKKKKEIYSYAGMFFTFLIKKDSTFTSVFSGDRLKDIFTTKEYWIENVTRKEKASEAEQIREDLMWVFFQLAKMENVEPLKIINIVLESLNNEERSPTNESEGLFNIIYNKSFVMELHRIKETNKELFEEISSNFIYLLIKEIIQNPNNIRFSGLSFNTTKQVEKYQFIEQLMSEIPLETVKEKVFINSEVESLPSLFPQIAQKLRENELLEMMDIDQKNNKKPRPKV